MGVIMTIKIRDVNVNYIQYGRGKDIVLLHGWGQNVEMMRPLGDLLQDKYRITILDFPGFGDSDEPKVAMTIYDYCVVLADLLNELEIDKPILIGHSFGGRVAILYASQHSIEKLVLFGSPCVRKKSKPSLKVRILKFLKKIPLINKLEGFAKKHMGSRDYRNASDIMRQILVNVVNEDLSKYAQEIRVPTLLMWGDCDTEAPLEDAKEMEKLISDCGLIVFANSTHYAYLENLKRVVKILNEFL